MPLLHKGQRVGSGPDTDRWQVIRKLGEGTFAEVYEVRDTKADGDLRLAMKVEKRVEIRSVKQEYKVMKRLAEQCPQICPVLHGGQWQHERWYMVMQLLGSNLVELRRSCQGGRLEPRVLRQIATSTLDCLQAVHSAGFIHRDIKPANFSIVPGSSADGSAGDWRLLDFGLARRFTDESGVVLAARPDAAFRGSTTYASVHAHAGSDQSRRDDLWSWLYCVVELAEGTLPWRQPDTGRDADGAGPDALKAAAAAAKQLAMQQPELLAKVTPMAGVVTVISSHLSSLGFSDTPDYGALRRALAAIPDHWEGPLLNHSTQPPRPVLAATIDLTLQPQHAAGAPVAADTQPPPWFTAPAQGSREAAAVSNMQQYLTCLQQGVSGPNVERLVSELCGLHPADTMAVVAAVLGSAVVATPAATCNALAALLSDVSAYAGHAAQQASSRFVMWQQEQEQREQQQRLQWQQDLQRQQLQYQQQISQHLQQQQQQQQYAQTAGAPHSSNSEPGQVTPWQQTPIHADPALPALPTGMVDMAWQPPPPMAEAPNACDEAPPPPPPHHHPAAHLPASAVWPAPAPQEAHPGWAGHPEDIHRAWATAMQRPGC